MITADEVRHIAKLAKIQLTDKEVEKFTAQLSDILDFVAQLSEVETKNVPETSQVTGLENISRADEIELCKHEEKLLECTPHEIEAHSVKIPKIM